MFRICIVFPTRAVVMRFSRSLCVLLKFLHLCILSAIAPVMPLMQLLSVACSAHAYLLCPLAFVPLTSGSGRGYQSVSQSDAVFSQDSYVTCFCLLDSDTLWDFSLFLCPTEAHMLELRAMGVKQFWTASETGSQMQLCLFWATTWCNTT